jgi:hypothetical protein
MPTGTGNRYQKNNPDDDHVSREGLEWLRQQGNP